MTSAIPTAPTVCQKLSLFIPTSAVVAEPSFYRKNNVREDDNDDHALLATLAVKVARLEQEVDRLENRFVLIARYIHIERAVLGLVTLVLASLAAYAMNKLLGLH
ncbi:MAG: hypothetical protein MUC51_19675 [Anaerolineae bacterium]|jgi:hypothetical protein|nr:hypothetical protein [Anaerolineae bacterium]